MNSKILTLIFLALVLIISLNIPDLLFFPINQSKWLATSASLGDRTHGLLSLYRYYFSRSDLSQVKKIERLIDPLDTQVIKSEYSPEILSKLINQLTYKTPKTTDDYIALSQLQIRLGQLDSAKNSLVQAQKSDPLRADVEQLVFEINQN